MKSGNGIKIVIIKLLLFILIANAVLWMLIMPQYLYGYNASLIDKISRLESIEEPKIILVGNSNIAFGIRSGLIESSMGMPVVNMGIHGGLGNRFHENLIKGQVKKGDIVIICHTDYSEVNSPMDPVLAWVTIENHFNLWKYVPKDEWYNMIKTFPTYTKKCIGTMEAEISNIQEDDECYSRLLFNEYGDNIYNETHDEKFEFWNEYISDIPEIDEDTILRINRLNEYVSDCGGTLLVAAYPIAVSDKDISAQSDKFEVFQNQLTEQLDCKVISDYRDYFYPYDYFFNTNMHLTNEGAVIRTKQLIEDLNENNIVREKNNE